MKGTVRRSLFVLLLATSACLMRTFRPVHNIRSLARLSGRNNIATSSRPGVVLPSILRAATIETDAPMEPSPQESAPSSSGHLLPRFLTTLKAVLVAIVFAIFSHKPIHYWVKNFFAESWANLKSELKVRLRPVAQHFAPLRQILTDGDDRYIRAYDLAIKRSAAQDQSNSVFKSGVTRASGFTGDASSGSREESIEMEDDVELFYSDSKDSSNTFDDDDRDARTAAFKAGIMGLGISSSGKLFSPRRLVRLHMVPGSEGSSDLSDSTNSNNNNGGGGLSLGGGLPIGRFLKEKWLEILPPELSISKMAAGKYDNWIDEGAAMEKEMEAVEAESRRTKSFWNVAKVEVEKNISSLFDGGNAENLKGVEKTENKEMKDKKSEKGEEEPASAVTLKDVVDESTSRSDDNDIVSSIEEEQVPRSEKVVKEVEKEDEEEEDSKRDEEVKVWSDFGSSRAELNANINPNTNIDIDINHNLQSAQGQSKSSQNLGGSSTSTNTSPSTRNKVKIPSLSDIGAPAPTKPSLSPAENDPLILSVPIPSLSKPENDAAVEVARARLDALGRTQDAEEALLAMAARSRQEEEARLAQVAQAKDQDEVILAELARKRKDRERELAAIAKKKLLEQRLQTATEAAAARKRAAKEERERGGSGDAGSSKKYGRRDRSSAKKLSPEEEEEEANSIASMVAELARTQTRCLMKTAVKAVLQAGNEGAMLTGQDPEELRKERMKKRKEKKMATSGDAGVFSDDDGGDDDQDKDEVDQAMEEIEETINKLSKDAFACFSKHVSDRV